MADQVGVCISVRAMPEVPVPLGWRVVQSPSGDAPAADTFRDVVVQVT
jgi:hypothetical protein